MGLLRALPLLLAGTCLMAVDLAVLEDGTAAQATTLGNMELGEGRYEAAISTYQRALKIDPTYFWARYNLALAYQQAGQYDQAQTWYEEALQVQGDHPDVLCNLGYLAYRAGRFGDAATRFQEAARLAAGSPIDAAQHWVNVGTAREKLGQWAAAGRAYQEAVTLNPKSFNAHFNLGTLHLSRLADDSQAITRAQAHLTTASDLSPDRPEAWLNLAQCHEVTRAADPLEAYAAALKASTAAFAGMANQVLWQRARFHHRAVPQRATLMREDLKRILATEPTFPGANGMLGEYFHALGDYDRAIELLEREVAGAADDPNNPIDLESHYLLAVIYADHKADPTKAIAHAAAYYQVRPDSPKIHELRRRALRLSASTMEMPTPRTGNGADHATGHSVGQTAAHDDGHAAPTAHHPAPAAPAHGPTAAPAHDDHGHAHPPAGSGGGHH
jgi:tetratricopeptide (TPR) repeat protein